MVLATRGLARASGIDETTGETNVVRLLDEDSDRALTRLALYLTAKEAKQMGKALEDLAIRLEEGRPDHVHVDDREYEHHLTLVLYSPDDLDGLQPRYRKLILEDR